MQKLELLRGKQRAGRGKPLGRGPLMGTSGPLMATSGLMATRGAALSTTHGGVAKRALRGAGDAAEGGARRVGPEEEGGANGKSGESDTGGVKSSKGQGLERYCAEMKRSKEEDGAEAGPASASKARGPSGQAKPVEKEGADTTAAERQRTSLVPTRSGAATQSPAGPGSAGKTRDATSGSKAHDQVVSPHPQTQRSHDQPSVLNPQPSTLNPKP